MNDNELASLPSPSVVKKSLERAKEATTDPDFQRMLDKPVGTVDMVNGIMIPRDMEGLYRIATMFYKSEGLKRGDIKSVFDVFLILSHGQAVGFHPVQAMNGIMVVNGRTTIWGDAALALCRNSEKCEGVKEWIEGEGENSIAFCECKRKDESESNTRSFTVGEAKQAGLWNRNVWKSYPKRMLQMRARAYALRDAFADVLSGLSITEEVRDYDVFDPEQANGDDPPLGKVKVNKPDFGFGTDAAEESEGTKPQDETTKPETSDSPEEKPTTPKDDPDTALVKSGDDPGTKRKPPAKLEVWETRVKELEVIAIERGELNDLDAAKAVAAYLQKATTGPTDLGDLSTFENLRHWLDVKTPAQIKSLVPKEAVTAT